jgi:hypothetical protein
MFKPEWRSGKKDEIISRVTADFTGWRTDDAEYEKQLERVVDALRTDAGAGGISPRPDL